MPGLWRCYPWPLAKAVPYWSRLTMDQQMRRGCPWRLPPRAITRSQTIRPPGPQLPSVPSEVIGTRLSCRAREMTDPRGPDSTVRRAQASQLRGASFSAMVRALDQYDESCSRIQDSSAHLAAIFFQGQQLCVPDRCKEREIGH